MSHESIIYICTTAAGIITLFVKSWIDNRTFRSLREQDRLDRESEARIRLADKKEMLQAGDARRDEILKETKQVKSVALKSALKSEEALRIANGHNEKIVTAVQVSKQVLEKFTEPSP